MATYGIDLGTTYSCIARVDETGRATVIKNAIGEETTPSVVWFEAPEQVVVGRTAKDTQVLLPDQVTSHVKRDIGQAMTSAHHGAEHTPESISALILKELARAAGEATGEPVHDVVITVPAYFGFEEREATRKAGQIAGLNVLNLVPEPVAAALHYDSLAGGGDRTILVYDLGGGTFDTTVIRLEGSDIRVVCTDGDHHLGGADWDGRLADHLLERFVQEHPGVDPSGDEHFLQELARDAERLKKELSTAQSRKHPLRYGGEAAQVELTREKVEELTADLLEQTLQITQRTIDTAKGLGVERFDEVLLVGGQTRMPAVAERLKERFGFEPRLHDPDLAVAKGAALFALIESIKIRLPDEAGAAAANGAGGAGGAGVSESAVERVADQLGIAKEQVRALAAKVVTAVVPRAFGTEVVDLDDPELRRSFIDHVLHANTPLPVTSEPSRYQTVYDHQTAIEVSIYQQEGATESAELEHNKRIGEGLIDGLPPLPKGSPLDVTFALDEMGNLRVHAVELSTGKDLDINVTIGELGQERVEAARHAIARYSVSA